MRGEAARRAFALATALAWSALSAPAHAAEPLEWNPAWPRFRPSEYVVTGFAGAASLGIYFGIYNASEPRWTGGILFDEAVRGALREHTRRALGAARFTSDLTVLTSLTWTVSIDSLAVPLLRQRSEIAAQLTLMNVEAFAISSLITNSMFKVIGRARPSYQDCERDPYFDSLCHLNDTSSFPSGHTSSAFTAAGLSCAHHLHLNLYGDRRADVLACAGSLALASVTGTLRMVGDRHYLSDVLVGAIIGFGVGYGVPTLLHYDKGSRVTEATPTQQPLGLPPPLGPSFSGTF